MVNCAISPLVEASLGLQFGYLTWSTNGKLVPIGAGIGGSAAWHILRGNDVLAAELAQGCGWQDHAVIQETGLCCWASGHEPMLVHHDSGDWLKGCMALHWTGKSHSSASIACMPRNYCDIANASYHACVAMQYKDLFALAEAVEMSYEQQLDEGMDELPVYGLASKYCGAGHGGYAVYLFESREHRDRAVSEKGMMAVEPYCK